MKALVKPENEIIAVVVTLRSMGRQTMLIVIEAAISKYAKAPHRQKKNFARAQKEENVYVFHGKE